MSLSFPKIRFFPENLKFLQKPKNILKMRNLKNSQKNQVRSCFLIALGHKSLRVLCGSVFQKCLGVSHKGTYRAVRGLLKIFVNPSPGYSIY